jgi:predicted DNA binding CopG/RHH family protein
MSDGVQLKTWVSKETKGRFAAIARHQGLSESAMLKRLVDLMLQTASAGMAPTAASECPSATDLRITVRLPTDDLTLLRERSTARGIAPSTYLAVLARAHLRNLAPLPKAEYLALKRTISELGSLARRLGSAAWAQGKDRRSDLSRDDARAILRVCEGLRDHVRALLQANLKSWKQGYGEPVT